MEIDLLQLLGVGLSRKYKQTELILSRWICPDMVNRCYLQCNKPLLLEAEATGLDELPFGHDSCCSIFAERALCRVGSG